MIVEQPTGWPAAADGDDVGPGLCMEAGHLPGHTHTHTGLQAVLLSCAAPNRLPRVIPGLASAVCMHNVVGKQSSSSSQLYRHELHSGTHATMQHRLAVRQKLAGVQRGSQHGDIGQWQSE